MPNETEQHGGENGFEYQGTFYRWSVSDVGKDLMLIDRFAQIPVLEFFEAIDDDHERARGPILLALIATSIRAEHPDWSLERITRLVMGLSMGEVAFIGGDDEEEEEPERPPVETAPEPPPADERSKSPSNGFSSSSTPPDSTNSPTYSALPT